MAVGSTLDQSDSCIYCTLIPLLYYKYMDSQTNVYCVYTKYTYVNLWLT